MMIKSPKPAALAKQKITSGIAIALALLLAALLVLLLIFAYYDNNASHPLFVQSHPHSPHHKTPLYVFIDPTRHQDSQTLLQTFAEHRPDIEMTIANAPDSHQETIVILGEVPNQSTWIAFDYALKNGQPLIGYIGGSDTASLAFRDFLLSSVAQDIFIATGFDSIEPYRNASFDSPKGDTNTADKTATQAVSGKALITAP